MPFARYPSLVAASAIGLTLAAPLHAGGSLFVDDAARTPDGRCQVESWLRSFAPGQELTLAPACGALGTEFSVGVGEFFNPHAGTLISLGAKRLFRDFEAGPFGIGASAGATWASATDRFESLSLSVPTSVALDSERRVVLHANIGWLDLRGADGSLTGGVGVEVALESDRVLLAEVYGQGDGVVLGQAGVRSPLGESVQLDLLVGYLEAAENSPWATVGLNVLLPE